MENIIDLLSNQQPKIGHDDHGAIELKNVHLRELKTTEDVRLPMLLRSHHYTENSTSKKELKPHEHAFHTNFS